MCGRFLLLTELSSSFIALDEQDIQRVWTRVRQELEGDESSDVQNCVNAITSLKGVGPATASAWLSRCDPKHFPFMGDPILELTQGDRKYTLEQYLQLVKDVREKVTYLNSTIAGDSGSSIDASDEPFTCEDIEKGIFIATWLTHGSSNPFGTSATKKIKL